MADETRNDAPEQEDIAEYIGTEENRGKGLILPGEARPRRMYVIPVSNRPFFPAQVQPVMVNQDPWQETLKRVGDTDHHMLGICYVEDPDPERNIPGSDELETMGCAVRVHHFLFSNVDLIAPLRHKQKYHHVDDTYQLHPQQYVHIFYMVCR